MPTASLSRRASKQRVYQADKNESFEDGHLIKS